MYNQGNMRLHVDIFIKYVSNNVYSDNNHGQPQSILNIFLTFLVAYTLWQPFVAYFRSDIYIIVFFCGAGWKRVGRRDCLTKKIFFFTSSGAQRWAEREMGNTKKNTATLILKQIIPYSACHDKRRQSKIHYKSFTLLQIQVHVKMYKSKILDNPLKRFFLNDRLVPIFTIHYSKIMDLHIHGKDSKKIH